MNGEAMMKRRIHAALFVLHVCVVLSALALVACALVARGQSSAQTPLAAVGDKSQPVAVAAAALSPPLSETERARFDKLRTEGFEALYNLDYKAARVRFEELARVFPTHPAGPQFLAAGLWLETLNSSRRLQSGVYNNDSFYAENEEKTDPRVVEQFKQLTRAAKQLAEARLKRDPKDAEALYFLGATQGLKAAFAGAVERRFIGALRDGSDAVDRHRDVVKLDPNFHDAELTLGMYDYIVGGLAAPVRMLVSIGGVRGSKRRGLATLERVAREGTWARDDARVMLLPLYKREQRFTDALKVARELAAKYPRNFIFKLESADALVSQAAVERKRNNIVAAAQAEQEAFAIFESLLRDKSAREAAARQLDLIHLQYGEALFVAARYDDAAHEFLSAATLPTAEANLQTTARLRAGQALDLAGKRNDALAQYRQVLARPNVYDSQNEAKRGLRVSYVLPTAKQGQDE